MIIKYDRSQSINKKLIMVRNHDKFNFPLNGYNYHPVFCGFILGLASISG